MARSLISCTKSTARAACERSLRDRLPSRADLILGRRMVRWDRGSPRFTTSNQCLMAKHDCRQSVMLMFSVQIATGWCITERVKSYHWPNSNE